MNIKKTTITLAAILGFAILFTGCGVIDKTGFQAAVDRWQTETPVYLSDANGEQIYTYNASPTAVDFDGNGTLDLVVGDGYGNIEVMVNGSTTGIEIQDFYMIGDEKGPSHFCDEASPYFYEVDLDGQPEMLVGCGDGSILYVDFMDKTPGAMRYWVGPASSDLAPVAVPGGFATPTVSDVSIDGTPDLVAGSGDGTIYYYSNSGVIGSPVLNFAGSGLNFGTRAAINTADLNDEGISDYVIGNGDGLVVACEGPTANNCLFVTQSVPGPAKPSVGDFNHDGFLDLVIGAADGSIEIKMATPPAP